MKKTTNNDLLFFRQETIPGGMLEHMECNYYISEEKTFYVIQENLDINGTPRGITTIEMPRDEFFGEIFNAIVDDGGVYGFRSRISAIVDNYLRICFGTLIWEVEAYLEDNTMTNTTKVTAMKNSRRMSTSLSRTIPGRYWR